MLKNRKDIEIRSLLEVTEAINKNLSSKALYRIFYFTCISMFKVKRMALIVLDENNKVIIEVRKEYFRPNEVDQLLGDSTKAKKILKWKPSYDFKSLVKEMVEKEVYDL